MLMSIRLLLSWSTDSRGFLQGGEVVQDVRILRGFSSNKSELCSWLKVFERLYLIVMIPLGAVSLFKSERFTIRRSEGGCCMVAPNQKIAADDDDDDDDDNDDDIDVRKCRDGGDDGGGRNPIKSLEYNSISNLNVPWGIHKSYFNLPILVQAL
ncbi:hypothetical protein M0802_006360 [Mischocyttarus mexicanus]|nr:hypothetical protein M0802_006360 [Mischocyttarus mexicanus]